ncbi:DNA translocase FtsK [Helicobacter sp. Faydin-H64]|uniref:DNA translocase FtsK n=2 Tax=Helicobacter turcicus TaxID=2867412 RepID=A0ABS7JP80_9HELI|nr:DNA translocase FtsK [Helicobacter turcicus]MBX7491188.1 DNA translocase FtsK [Helicobacter turcicus]MBX7546055.1 DNA translocase FtsK [Helicobacter turcicus]
MASLESFKRFEKSNFYHKEEQKEEPIKLIKKESVAQGEYNISYGDALEVASVPQVEPLKEESKKQVIKAYPKNLYAATPFSAYYDKEPVGTHDCLIDIENIYKGYPSKSEKDELPRTIFYYGDKVSTHPLSENTEAQNMESKAIEVVETPQEAALTQNVESKIESQVTQQVTPQVAQESAPQQVMQQPIFQTSQIKEIPTPRYVATLSVIPTFDYNYGHYQESAQQAKPQQVKSETINLFQDSKQKVAQNTESKIAQAPQQIIEQSTSQILTEVAPKQAPMPQSQFSPQAAESQAPQHTQQLVQSQTHTLVKTLEENAVLLEDLEMTQTPQVLEPKDYELPKLEFLQEPKSAHVEIDESEIDRKINDLLNKMRVFKIEGDIVRTYSGPIVTTFEFRPSPNVKVSRILTLQDDLAMALRAKTIRIQAPIPGKDVVGIEIPNAQVETIYLREILENDLFKHSVSPLTLALGKDIVGNPFVTDLKKLPHLLIAGTTGSGKSVGINAMILSLLYKNPPDKLKLIMVDPKMVEFSIYNDIPHLLTPVITSPKNAIFALDVAVKEMEQRNALISEARVKNIESYNQKAEMEGFEPFPYIVIIIDELADLMMTGGKEAEASISRLTQMARSSGIHLIVATQRPSVDVVTGLIKANLPSRISYKVGQKIDSKVILDCHGAESLLGNGDMLFAMGGGNVTRLHAPFSTEEEIERIVEFIKVQCPPQYDERFLQKEERLQVQSNGDADDLYEEAKRIMLADGKTSISYIQRRLGIGFNKAANIVEQMQQRGFLSKENSKGVREIIGE